MVAVHLQEEAVRLPVVMATHLPGEDDLQATGILPPVEAALQEEQGEITAAHPAEPASGALQL